MRKYAEYVNLKSGKMEISEKTLLDNLDGITVSGDLISNFGNGVKIYWNYVEIVYTLSPHGAVPTTRGRADYIRYCHSPFDDEGFKSILLNPKNEGHPGVEKVRQLRENHNEVEE